MKHKGTLAIQASYASNHTENFLLIFDVAKFNSGIPYTGFDTIRKIPLIGMSRAFLPCPVG